MDASKAAHARHGQRKSYNEKLQRQRVAAYPHVKMMACIFSSELISAQEGR